MTRATHVLRLTRDGAEVARVALPRADYLAIRRAARAGWLTFQATGRNAALRMDLVTPGKRVYRLSVERERAK